MPTNFKWGEEWISSNMFGWGERKSEGRRKKEKEKKERDKVNFKHAWFFMGPSIIASQIGIKQ